MNRVNLPRRVIYTDLSEQQSTVIFALIGVEMLLIYAKTLKQHEKRVLMRHRLILLEMLGEVLLDKERKD